MPHLSALFNRLHYSGGRIERLQQRAYPSVGFGCSRGVKGNEPVGVLKYEFIVIPLVAHFVIFGRQALFPFEPVETELVGGDWGLATRCVMLSTLCAVVTVPLWLLVTIL